LFSHISLPPKPTSFLLRGTETSASNIPTSQDVPTALNGLFSGSSAKDLYGGGTNVSSISFSGNALSNISASFSGCLVSGVNIYAPALTNSSNAFINSTIKTFSISSDTSSIQNMNGMFDGCNSLNNDFTGFSLAGISSNNLNTFMRGVTLSNANYNKILVYWNSNKASYPYNNIIIHMGNSRCDTTSGGANGIAAKLALINYGWTITDGQ